MVTLTDDAIILGLGFLNGPKATLEFGGPGAQMRITNRARAALTNLVLCGFAEQVDPNQPKGAREKYRGKDDITTIARARRVNPLADENRWPAFVAGGA